MTNAKDEPENLEELREMCREAVKEVYREQEQEW